MVSTLLQRLRNGRESNSSEPDEKGDNATVVQSEPPVVINAEESVKMPAPEQSKTMPTPRPATQGTDAKTIIGKGIVVTGEITGNGDVDIRGTVVGNIELKNNAATVSRTGVAQASITAKNVEVAGRVEGDIVAQELVIIRKDSTIAGNVASGRVSLEDGAHFKGSIDMSASTGNASGSGEQQRRQMGASNQQGQGGQRPGQPPQGGSVPGNKPVRPSPSSNVDRT